MGEAAEGVGGVFFRASDPVALRAWYAEHLGIDMEEYGTTFTAKDGDQTVWAPFPADTASRWLLRDRDAIYGDVFRRRVASMGIGELVSSPSSPW